jgi:hypothetical protein
MTEFGVDVDEAAVNWLARSEGALHRGVASTFGIVDPSPKGVAAKGEMSHEMGVQIGKAP